MNMGIVSVHAWPRLGKGTDAACPQLMFLASQMQWGLNLGGSAVPGMALEEGHQLPRGHHQVRQ